MHIRSLNPDGNGKINGIILECLPYMHTCDDLVKIFGDCFLASYNTQLVKGADEPLYLPADENRRYHELFFTRDYFASALHETSHWLIAGAKRRQLIDFGYWYAPDGRSQEQQALFASVEVKPQAMEWILSQAASFRFRISLDNLNGQDFDSSSFKTAIYQQVEVYCRQGLSSRAETFRRALCRFYEVPLDLNINDFNIEDIC